MPALGLRTIWIALRAVNYTDFAFQKTIINLNNLMKAEEAATKATIQHAKYAAMAGMMWMSLGVMLGQAGMEMARTTTTLKPFVNVVDSLFKTMEKSEALRTFVSILLLAVSALTIFGGAAMMVKAIQDIAWLPSVHRMIVAHQALAGALGACAAGFMIFFVLKDVLGPIPAALFAVAAAMAILVVQMWMAAGAMSVLTWGLAAVAGGAALAGAIAVAAGAGKYQMGTRSAGATGLAFVHKHEVIYNPTTNRPTQVGNDLNRGAGETNFYEMPVTIETVNTKADIEDLDKKMSEAWRRRMRRRR
jgi:hypothetical protein